jgi:hypothetical protein
MCFGLAYALKEACTVCDEFFLELVLDLYSCKFTIFYQNINMSIETQPLPSQFSF